MLRSGVGSLFKVRLPSPNRPLRSKLLPVQLEGKTLPLAGKKHLRLGK